MSKTDGVPMSDRPDADPQAEMPLANQVRDVRHMVWKQYTMISVCIIVILLVCALIVVLMTVGPWSTKAQLAALKEHFREMKNKNKTADGDDS